MTLSEIFEILREVVVTGQIGKMLRTIETLVFVRVTIGVDKFFFFFFWC